MEPYKFDDKRKAEYLELLRKGGRRGLSATAVGVNRQTVTNHMKDDEDFADAVRQAEMDANETVENALYKLATDDKNMAAIKMWLNNRANAYWKDKQSLELSGVDGEAIEVNVLANVPTEELKARLEILKEAAE